MATAIGGAGSNNVTISRVRVVSTTTAISHGGDNWVIDDVSANIVSNFLTSTAGHSYLTITNCFTAGLIDISDCDWVSITGNQLRSLIELGAASSVTIVGNTLDSPGGAGSSLVNGDGVRGLIFAGNNYTEADGYDAMTLANSDQVTISDSIFGNITAGIALTSCSLATIHDVTLGGQASFGSAYLGQHGIALTDCDRAQIHDVLISEPGQDANDTYDGINISGASDRNKITDSTIIPSTQANTTRSAVNVGGTGECNMVVGNDLGDSSDYGTDALIDTASNTQITYPNDMTYGDNWTDCGSGS